MNTQHGIRLSILVLINNCTYRMFQDKLCLITCCFHKKNSFTFDIVKAPFCSFSKFREETTIQIFCSCAHTQYLWNKIHKFLPVSIEISNITSQSPNSGFPQIIPNPHNTPTNHLDTV